MATDTTEPATTPTADPEATDPQAGTVDAPDAQAAEDTPEDTDDTEPAAGSEAAKYRRKLREAEAERDDLAARVEALQRAQVVTLLEAARVKPDAVFAVAPLADLLAEDGTVDPDKVKAAIDSARDRFGIATPTKGSYVPGIGNQPSAPPKVDAFTQAFAPSRGR